MRHNVVKHSWISYIIPFKATVTVHVNFIVWVMIEILVDVWSLESAFDYFDFSMDTTLVDFNDMKWERGDISFIFNGEAKPNQSLTVLDNKLKVFQRIRYEVSTF